MVFVLADVKPPLAGRTGCRGALFKYRAHADVHPVARQSSGLRCRLAHAGHEHGHTVVIQHGLESVDITFVDGALRDAADLVAGRESVRSTRSKSSPSAGANSK